MTPPRGSSYAIASTAHGNRQLNLALHRIAITQGRSYPPARDYLARRQTEGKTRKEALRALKRHLARRIFGLMVLLSQLIRTAAVTGRTDTIDASWFAGRQGGRWVEQTVAAAFPTAARHTRRGPPAVATRPAAEPAEALRELTKLHQRGVLTSAELEHLRARLGV